MISLPGAESKPDRVFTLSKEAKLTLDGRKTSIKNIKANMWVGGRAKRLSSESVEAKPVNVKT